MKRLAVLVTSIILALNPSQAKTSDVVQATPYQKRSALKNPMLTKNVLARAVPRAQRRLLATNNLTDDENDDPPGPDELDLQSPYARQRVVERRKDVDTEELSDYITVRLAVARAKAMEKYREQHA